MTTTDNSRADALTGKHVHALMMAKMASCTCLMKTPDPQFHDGACRYRLLAEVIDFIERPVEQHEAAPVDAENFACYLIDKCERETVTEENVQAWLGAMLRDPQYATTQPAPSAPLEGTGNGADERAAVRALRRLADERINEPKLAMELLAIANEIARAPRTEVAGAVPGWEQGVEAVAKMLDKKAADYVDEFGYVEHDTGALSFGQGAHADVKRDYHSSLVELAEEVRELAKGGSHA